MNPWIYLPNLAIKKRSVFFTYLAGYRFVHLCHRETGCLYFSTRYRLAWVEQQRRTCWVMSFDRDLWPT